MASETVVHMVSGEGVSVSGQAIKFALVAFVEGDGSNEPTHLEKECVDGAESAVQAMRAFGVPPSGVKVNDLRCAIAKVGMDYLAGITVHPE